METKSQTQRILNYLLSGNKLTALDALKKFNCFRLASRINELRDKYKIQREMITLKSGARVARYSINL